MIKSYTGRIKYSARVLLNGKYGFFAAVTMLVALCNFLLNHILSSVFSGNGLFNMILQLICSVLMNMIFYILLVGQQRLYLNVCRDEAYGFYDLFSSFTGHPEQIALYSVFQFVIQSLILNSAVYLLFEMWTMSLTKLLLSLFGLIIGLIIFVWVQLTLGFVLSLFADNPYITAKDAMQESIYMMNGNRRKLCKIYISFIGIYLLNLLSFGIGALFTEPYVKITLTLFYMEQRGEYSTEFR